MAAKASAAPWHISSSNIVARIMYHMSIGVMRNGGIKRKRQRNNSLSA